MYFSEFLAARRELSIIVKRGKNHICMCGGGYITITNNHAARDRCTGRHALRVPLEMEILPACDPSSLNCRLFPHASYSPQVSRFSLNTCIIG